MPEFWPSVSPSASTRPESGPEPWQGPARLLQAVQSPATAAVLSFRSTPRQQPRQGERSRPQSVPGAGARSEPAAPLPLFSAPRRQPADPATRSSAGTAGLAPARAVRGRSTREVSTERRDARRSQPRAGRDTRESRRRAAAPSPLRPFAAPPDPAAPVDSFASLPAAPQPDQPRPAGLAVFTTDGHLLAVTQERREMLCSLIGLGIKLGLVVVTSLSLVQIAGAYQQRMDSNGEIVAVLELEKARLERARERFDALFIVEGEQRLIREQSQWIAPNRLRVIWQSAEATPKPMPRP